MIDKTTARILIVAGLLSGTAIAAQAGTTGTEFQAAYTLMTGWIGGFLGRAIAIAFLIVGLFMGIARQNLMACGIAIAAAFALLITPTIMDNILSATVSAETVAPAAIEMPVPVVPGTHR